MSDEKPRRCEWNRRGFFLLIKISINHVGEILNHGLCLSGVRQILGHDAEDEIVARRTENNGCVILHCVQLSGLIGNLGPVNGRDSSRNLIAAFLFLEQGEHQIRVSERITAGVDFLENFTAV